MIYFFIQTLVIFLFALSAAFADSSPSESLMVPENAVNMNLQVSGNNSCIAVTADGGFSDDDQPTDGRGDATTENEINLIYSYRLVPNLQGNHLVYRGLMPRDQAVNVQLSANGGRALIDVLRDNLNNHNRVDLLFLENCDQIAQL